MARAKSKTSSKSAAAKPATPASSRKASPAPSRKASPAPASAKKSPAPASAKKSPAPAAAPATPASTTSKRARSAAPAETPAPVVAKAKAAPAAAAAAPGGDELLATLAVASALGWCAHTFSGASFFSCQVMTVLKSVPVAAIAIQLYRKASAKGIWGFANPESYMTYALALTVAANFWCCGGDAKAWLTLSASIFSLCATVLGCYDFATPWAFVAAAAAILVGTDALNAAGMFNWATPAATYVPVFELHSLLAKTPLIVSLVDLSIWSGRAVAAILGAKASNPASINRRNAALVLTLGSLLLSQWFKDNVVVTLAAVTGVAPKAINTIAGWVGAFFVASPSA